MLEDRPINGLRDRSAWHLKDSETWINLHPVAYSENQLNKNIKYQIIGIPVDRAYGTVSVWVKREPKELQ